MLSKITGIKWEQPFIQNFRHPNIRVYISHTGHDRRQLKEYVIVRQFAHLCGQIVQLAVKLLLRMQVKGARMLLLVLLPQKFDVLDPILFPLGQLRLRGLFGSRRRWRLLGSRRLVGGRRVRSRLRLGGGGAGGQQKAENQEKQADSLSHKDIPPQSKFTRRKPHRAYDRPNAVSVFLF